MTLARSPAHLSPFIWNIISQLPPPQTLKRQSLDFSNLMESLVAAQMMAPSTSAFNVFILGLDRNKAAALRILHEEKMNKDMNYIMKALFRGNTELTGTFSCPDLSSTSGNVCYRHIHEPNAKQIPFSPAPWSQTSCTAQTLGGCYGDDGSP